MTPPDPTARELEMARAILRWWRAQDAPRHAQIKAEEELTKIAKKLVAF
jgi:hypothetical protein